MNRAAADLYRRHDIDVASISDIKSRLHAAYVSENPNITRLQREKLQLELNRFVVNFPMNVSRQIPIPAILTQVEAIIRNTNNRPALGNGGRRSRRRRTRHRRTRRTRHRR
jgi:hypothetical protein